jgi:hypothetical protein
MKDLAAPDPVPAGLQPLAGGMQSNRTDPLSGREASLDDTRSTGRRSSASSVHASDVTAS